jgi:hypothetical protein
MEFIVGKSIFLCEGIRNRRVRNPIDFFLILVMWCLILFVFDHMSSIAHMTITAQKVVDNLKINYRRNVRTKKANT